MDHLRIVPPPVFFFAVKSTYGLYRKFFKQRPCARAPVGIHEREYLIGYEHRRPTTLSQQRRLGDTEAKGSEGYLSRRGKPRGATFQRQMRLIQMRSIQETSPFLLAGDPFPKSRSYLPFSCFSRKPYLGYYIDPGPFRNFGESSRYRLGRRLTATADLADEWYGRLVEMTESSGPFAFQQRCLLFHKAQVRGKNVDIGAIPPHSDLVKEVPPPFRRPGNHVEVLLRTDDERVGGDERPAGDRLFITHYLPLSFPIHPYGDHVLDYVILHQECLNERIRGSLPDAFFQVGRTETSSPQYEGAGLGDSGFTRSVRSDDDHPRREVK